MAITNSYHAETNLIIANLFVATTVVNAIVAVGAALDRMVFYVDRDSFLWPLNICMYAPLLVSLLHT